MTLTYLQGHKDQINVRQEVAPVTGSTTTVGSPYDHLVFTNASTTAVQTVNLPTGVSDGHVIKVSNVSQITALTFSPAVSGFTNASQLNAGQGLVLQWSSTFATPGWFVEKS